MNTHKISHFLERMTHIVDLRQAEAWDNVGLLFGDRDAPVKNVLLTIDLTEAVLEEAVAMGADLVVAYHPPLFAPLKKVVAPSLAYKITKSGIAVFSPHTALDCAAGGTNDVLADVVQMKERRALVPRASGDEERTKAGQVKLVTFVPEANVDAVCEALFAIGAGHIGAYRKCSFRNAGTGTFFGGEGANPAVGKAFRFEEVAEVRVEMVLPAALVSPAVAALRRAHPYEEPAFDLLPLAAIPDASASTPAFASTGMGRIGTVDADIRTLVECVRLAVGTGAVLVAGDLDTVRANEPKHRVATLAGSAGDLLFTAIDQGADVVVTGEVRHHDALAAVARGAVIICTLHSNSERLALPALGAKISAALDGVDVRISATDRDPFRFFLGASSSS